MKSDAVTDQERWAAAYPERFGGVLPKQTETAVPVGLVVREGWHCRARQEGEPEVSRRKPGGRR